MANDFFRFKQFTVYQDRCAMKVTMDACIFGAWVQVRDDMRHVLDVGTGTGLLSLMLAQRFPLLEIDAIEIDSASASQAAENVAASPFADRIRVIAGDARELLLHRKYDLLISNPPFFHRSLQSGDTRRMDVRHANSLSMQDLLRLGAEALRPDGQIAVLWPMTENRRWWRVAQTEGFYLGDQLCIQSNTNARRSCTASTYRRGSPTSSIGRSEVLSIMNNDGSYTDRFAELLGPFYLKL
jgi:tRNA1Val (adenine37-N6)-methyltransferase